MLARGEQQREIYSCASTGRHLQRTPGVIAWVDGGRGRELGVRGSPRRARPRTLLEGVVAVGLQFQQPGRLSQLLSTQGSRCAGLLRGDLFQLRAGVGRRAAG